MSEEYILTRDIIYDHNERMLNIRKYYPYFRLSEMSFRQYKDGQFDNLDMGYILMAVLRFFIEKNNFNEEQVAYGDYEEFILELLRRDFDVRAGEQEEKELALFIFDKIRNEGRPFIYEYFNPVDKKKQSLRIRVIDSRIIEGKVYYSITSDAVEFYLDTKEVKDESNITIEQVLLGKLISSKNFKGGTKVVRRINNEVGRLLARKNEVLNILSQDVFQGVNAYEEFNNTVVRWFEEEQKLFTKNKELIEQALRQGESENKYYSAMEEIYQLESELNRAITRHGRLLRECTDLQMKADEIITKAKFGKLRTSFDFGDYMKGLMEADRVDLLENIILPMLGLNIKKVFDVKSLDEMLTYNSEKAESGEKIVEEQTEEYVYEDLVEEQRIEWNYRIFIDILFRMIVEKDSFTLKELEEKVIQVLGSEVLKNGDWYSFLVHLCQKKSYNVIDIVKKPDTFLEEILKGYFDDKEGYEDIAFSIESADDEIKTEGIAVTGNLRFIRRL